MNNTKISDEVINAERQMFKNGMTLNEISAQTGAPRSTIRKHITPAMWIKVHKTAPKTARNTMTKQDKAYVESHYLTCTSVEIAAELDKEPRFVTNTIQRMRSRGELGRKNHARAYGITEVRKMSDGIRSKMKLSAFKDIVIKGKILKLQAAGKTEKCLVEYVNNSYFVVKRKNYRDSYKFASLLEGEIKILA